MRKNLVYLLLFLSCSTVSGQVDYNRQYANAKDLFKERKYSLAMESFKPLVAYDRNNPFSEYASFFYALSAYQQGFKAVAKDMLNQIKTVHPNWDKMHEVNFWLGKIHFDNGDYFQGMKVFSAINDKKTQKDIEAVKKEHIPSIEDVETLRMMNEEYPRDAVVGKSLATALAKNSANEEDKQQLESLISEFKLKRTDFIPEAPKTIHKERYAIALMLPFNLSTLDPSPGRKRNQVILDFYEGMKLALDSLQRQGVNVTLRAYDTERNVERIATLLATEELKNTDLIVGPLFPEENKIVQEFSLQNKINTIHPFSNSSDMIGLNPHAYLFQPTSETLGRKAADFVAGEGKDKKCFVFYGPGKQDSVLAYNFIQQAGENGVKVILTQKIPVAESRVITDMLATPTEFDEFKYPIEFSMRKDSIDCILVASDDPVIYTKVVGAVETRGDSIMVIGSENWIEDNAIDLEKYQVQRIVLAAPNFADNDKAAYRIFRQKFLKKYGRLPGNVARMGYELMLFAGQQLKQNGVYFQEGLSRSAEVPGALFEGFRFESYRDNQLIPFIGMKNEDFMLIKKL